MAAPVADLGLLVGDGGRYGRMVRGYAIGRILGRRIGGFIEVE